MLWISTNGFFDPTIDLAPHNNKSASNDGDKARGLVYNSADLTQLFSSSSAISWAYNWKSEPLGDLSPHIQFVPMLWGTKQSTIELWTKNADKAIASGSTHFLAFNEPDLDSQAKLSPSEAATAWLQHLEPYAGKVKLGSPAVTNGQKAGKGLNWLSGFLDACHDDCTIDFIAIHWYGHAGDEGLQNFKNHIAKARETAKGRPVWITEFQPQGEQTEQANFLAKILPWLDDKGQSGVDRYAYWKVDGYLATTSGNKLTESGVVYAAWVCGQIFWGGPVLLGNFFFQRGRLLEPHPFPIGWMFIFFKFFFF